MSSLNCFQYNCGHNLFLTYWLISRQPHYLSGRHKDLLHFLLIWTFIILLLNYLDFHFKRMCFFSMVVAINVWCGSAFEPELVDDGFYWGGVVSTCFDTHKFNHLSFLSIIGRQTLSLNSLLATKYFMYCRNFFVFHLGQTQVPYVISLSRNFIKCIDCI